MATYDNEHLNGDLAELTAILRAWDANKDSDSVKIQNLRSTEFGLAIRMTEKLVYGVQPEGRIQLRVGKTAIRGERFTKNSYDFYRSSPRDLEADSTLQLDRAEPFRNISEQRSDLYDLYVGRFILVKLGIVATTLRDGGELSVIEVGSRTGQASQV